MDWKLLLSTFTMVFLAEMGDKTQLATLSLASGSQSKLSVFAGSALALICTSAVAVVGAEAVTRIIPPQVMRYLAGGLLIVLGVLTLVVREGGEGP